MAQPSAIVPQASESWSDTKATYNFWKSEGFDYLEQNIIVEWKVN
ncbi:transposase DNA-binding-containing protein [Geminocystis sp. CENA526]